MSLMVSVVLLHIVIFPSLNFGQFFMHYIQLITVILVTNVEYNIGHLTPSDIDNSQLDLQSPFLGLWCVLAVATQSVLSGARG